MKLRYVPLSCSAGSCFPILFFAAKITYDGCCNYRFDLNTLHIILIFSSELERGIDLNSMYSVKYLDILLLRAVL